MDRAFNQCEAVLWLVVALIFLLKSCRARPPLRRVFIILGATFFVFSMTDVIEAQTGAWWEPPWLIVLKAACVATLVWGFRRYYRVRMKR